MTGELGSTVLLTATVRVREVAYAFGDDARRNDPERSDAAWWTLRHEMVHTLQALSSQFLVDHTRIVRAQLGTFWAAVRAGDVVAAHAAYDVVRTLDAVMDVEEGAERLDGVGVSARELMEGVALVEAERARSSVLTGDALKRLLRDAASPLYGRALGVLIRRVGLEPAVRLLPALAFAALNTSSPGADFAGAVQALGEWTPSRLADLGPADVIDRSPGLVGPLAAIAAGPVTHNDIWDGILAEWASSGPAASVVLTAAYPSSLLGAANAPLFGRDPVADLRVDALPPVPLLTLYGDGRGRLSRGLADRPPALVEALLHSDELLGLMYGLALPERRFATACSHGECPAHRFQVCQLAYPPPPGAHHDECGFRRRVRRAVGQPVESVATVFARRPSG